jgi:hypothetical protein
MGVVMLDRMIDWVKNTADSRLPEGAKEPIRKVLFGYYNYKERFEVHVRRGVVYSAKK